MSDFIAALRTAANGDRGITTGVPHTPVRTSWSDIHDVSRRGAAVLREHGLESGGAVAILAGMPSDVTPAAQAIWLAGGSVTMLQQPTARTNLMQYGADTLAALHMINAEIVIVGEPFLEVAAMLTEAGFIALTADQLRAGEHAAEPIDIPEDSMALLQLTSGSTAVPKAVQITHRNLWANITSMVETAAIDSTSDVMVSWLPLFHDMGMVGFLALPMCLGVELIKATPADFLRAPLSWMELIDTYRGTVTAAPNFAYALAARVLRRADGLDLSSLRYALNGAEPIDMIAVDSFVTAGKPFGLPATAVVPGYGMAEATLGVSFHPRDTPIIIDVINAIALEEEQRAVPVAANGDADTREFPLLGPPLPGMEVEVRGPAGDVLAEREVGEFFLRGEAVTAGYLTVDGPVAACDDDGWLATGDVGYFADGAVVVCGRAKDVIIMGGRNIYPTDIERAAQSVAGVRAGNAVAVRIDGGQRREGFAVIVESRKVDDEAAAEAIAVAVRSAVTAQVGARPHIVKVVSAGTLPKTPSGKIKRTAAADLLD